MTTLLMILVLMTFIFAVWQWRPLSPRRAQRWHAHVIWVPPARTGDAVLDARNLRDRSKWTRVHTNRP
jgi:hypothetical protein